MKKAIIAWGRMNPVTAGHEKLVNKVKTLARREGGEPRIYLSHTQNAKKDPLQYKDKIAMGKKAFGSVIKTSTSRTLIQLMQELQKAGYTEIVMVAGSDRVSEYNTLLNKYNGKDYTFDKIKLVSAGQRDPDAEGTTGMSATKIRKAAQDGKFDDYVDGSGKKQLGFKSGLPSALKSADAKRLYKLVRKGLLVEEINRIDEEELENFSEDELESFIDQVEDWDELDEEYIEERAPLTLQQRIKKARIMKRLAPKLKRQREIRKFRMAPTERLVQRARKLARNLLRKKMAGKRGEQYNKLSASQKIQVDTLVQKKASSIERIAKRMLPMVRKKEIERIRSARSSKKEAIERFENSFKILSEKISTPQDSDIEDKKGTQPKKYHSGLSKSTKTARDAHFKKGAKMDDSNPAAYKPAPGDARAKTKPSVYTKRYKELFGEKEAVSKARERIKREKEADKEKHDRILDLARTQDTRAKNAQNESFELTEKSMDALKKKASKSGLSYGTLKKVYNRGVAAWKTGHRPGTTPQQWGYARVNAFITKKKAGNLNHDKDLANEYIPESYNNWSKQDFKNASENFQDGKNPQDKGDAGRHGLKGKTKAQLKKIRSSSIASKRKKQLAHWMINMHYNEEHGAGEDGTNKLAKKYKKDTPGQ